MINWGSKYFGMDLNGNHVHERLRRLAFVLHLSIQRFKGRRLKIIKRRQDQQQEGEPRTGGKKEEGCSSRTIKPKPRVARTIWRRRKTR